MLKDPATFDKARAASYDERIRVHIPGYESLHSMALELLRGAMPAAAELLVVGAGTGMEVATFGAAMPGWRFMAVDPSGPMLDVAREKVRAAGVEPRARFHEGFVDSLSGGPFDGATSLLVSHFISDLGKKRAYFQAIADRLKPGAPLVQADLCGRHGTPAFDLLFAGWRDRALRSALPSEDIKALIARMEADLSFVPEDELADLLLGCGFERPVPFYRGFMFGGWFMRKRAA